jgi:hypothetical protein
MELKEFVRDTLLEVLQGINEAQLAIEVGKAKGIINPIWKHVDKLYEHIQDINFDIAVTASDKASGSSGGGIKVVAADLSGKVSKEKEKSSVSRISFKVPVVPPYMKVDDVAKP